MQKESQHTASYVEIIGHTLNSTNELLKNELSLIKKRTTAVVQIFSENRVRIALLFVLMVISSFAVCASAVLGLGLLLNGRYWLSAFIVGVAAFFAGAFLAVRIFKSLKVIGNEFRSSYAEVKAAAGMITDRAIDLKQAMQEVEIEPPTN